MLFLTYSLFLTILFLMQVDLQVCSADLCHSSLPFQLLKFFLRGRFVEGFGAAVSIFELDCVREAILFHF